MTDGWLAMVDRAPEYKRKEEKLPLSVFRIPFNFSDFFLELFSALLSWQSAVAASGHLISPTHPERDKVRDVVQSYVPVRHRLLFTLQRRGGRMEGEGE